MMRKAAQSFLQQKNRTIFLGGNTHRQRLLGPEGLRFFHATTLCSAAPTPAPDTKKKSKKNNEARDTRIAGRRRFYKQVGVVETLAPWVSVDDNVDNNNSTVASPISAGVDGTDSASGVSRNLSKDSQLLYEQLLPRRPGTTVEAANTAANTSNNTKWWSVTLDGRSIQTPMGQVLAVPSQHLAYAIAAEWDQQVTVLKPVQMPLMTLACTTLDQTASHADVYRKQVLNYLPTDTVCYWADPTNDRVLYRRQEEAWRDLHVHAEQSFGETLVTALGTDEGMIMARNSKTAGLPLAPSLTEKCRAWVYSLDAWHLTAMASCASEAKSFWVAWALVNQHSQQQEQQEKQQSESPFHKDLTKAVEAARVEEEFQISSWGLVEGQHDYDRLNCTVQLHGAVLLCDSLAVDNGWL
jgi:ATP synthase F1 complex assembly factor 2